jgi:hypothetical protein
MKKSELRQIIREEIKRQLNESLDVTGWETADDYVTLKFDGDKTLDIMKAKGPDGDKVFKFILTQLKNYKTNKDSKAFIDNVVDKNKVRIK